MNIKLKDWQKKFLQFASNNKNKIINLYGYPSGKSFIAFYDKNSKDRVYYHYESLYNLVPIYNDINNGKTVIIITIDKLHADLQDLIYFEVMEDDT